MNKSRKSFKRITEVALRKLKRFYKNGLHAYCTPYEYICLCWHFGVSPEQYYIDRAGNGDSAPFNAFILVDESIAEKYDKHPQAMPNVIMR